MVGLNMRKIFTAFLIGGTILATGAMAEDYMVVPKASQKFKAGPGNFYSQDLLLNHKNAQANITMRDRSGQAEVHAAWEDHIFILEGECTMMLGGTIFFAAGVRTDEGDYLLAGDNWVGLLMILAGSLSFALYAYRMILTGLPRR